MSDGFKIPTPGGASTWQPGDQGGDLRDLQYVTLALAAFIAAVLPVAERSVVSLGLTVPTDPHALHRAADGWSSFGGSVYAAGRTAQQQHDNVSPAGWQAPERDLSGQRMAGYALASDSASSSAQDISTLLRWVANIYTGFIYVAFLVVSACAAATARSLLMGPGGRLYGHLVAKSMVVSHEGRVLQLLNLLVASTAIFAALGAGALVMKYGLTDGLKPSHGAGRPEGGTAKV